MKDLNDIPKKEIFEVPDGYFEHLPQVIQSRISKPQKQERPYFKLVVRYALAIAIVFVVLWLWLVPSKQQTAEELLAGVNSEELIQYLNETGVELDDIFSSLEIDDVEVDRIEEEVFGLFPEEATLDEHILQQL
ncbi:MAG: hypothetical protein N2044_12820 [Cyclobacteriaceae bacterium]|nr:hypothetical protein [Cyclobacteriaceae bacterium]